MFNSLFKSKNIFVFSTPSFTDLMCGGVVKTAIVKAILLPRTKGLRVRASFIKLILEILEMFHKISMDIICICNGLFQKISTPPPWTTLNRVLKNFRISKNNSSRFCRIPNHADTKHWGIPGFCKTFNDFRGIPVKIHKILGKFMDFQSSLLSIFYRISNVVHGGCVDIFWNSPIDWIRNQIINLLPIINI